LVLESQVGKDRGLIHMPGDLLDPAPCRDVLSARKRSTPRDLSEIDQVLRDQWHSTPRALLPRSVRGRIDDNLTEDSPTGVVRIAPRDEKPAERLGHPLRFRLSPMAVKVA
jgi:hypothetical protein